MIRNDGGVHRISQADSERSRHSWQGGRCSPCGGEVPPGHRDAPRRHQVWESKISAKNPKSVLLDLFYFGIKSQLLIQFSSFCSIKTRNYFKLHRIHSNPWYSYFYFHSFQNSYHHLNYSYRLLETKDKRKSSLNKQLEDYMGRVQKLKKNMKDNNSYKVF